MRRQISLPFLVLAGVLTACATPAGLISPPGGMDAWSEIARPALESIGIGE